MTPASPDPAESSHRLSVQVVDRTAGAARLLTLRTPVRNVVSIRASLRTWPDFAEGEELLQGLTVALLDKGTLRRDRFAIAELLEDRGAQLSFDSDGLFVACSGRSLREDVEEVLGAAAEQLREPLLDAGEFDKARARMIASLRRAMENTASQASSALARRLYGRSHPNYTEAPAAQIARLEALTLDDVRAYHAAHFGANALTVVLVGDVDHAAAERAVADAFGDWPAGTARAAFSTGASPQPPGREALHIPDRENVDVRMGHPLRVFRGDPDYVPLYLANYILGGNFSARLMTVIRDEMGLTYGIRSGFSGISNDYQGHWLVSVTRSRENGARGVEATLAEVRRFVDAGVREHELAEKQTTISGAYKVGLATTGGLATVLLTNAERGFDVGYMDRFPEEVAAVTLEEVNSVLRRHFDPSQLQIAMAGMVPEMESA